MTSRFCADETRSEAITPTTKHDIAQLLVVGGLLRLLELAQGSSKTGAAALIISPLLAEGDTASPLPPKETRKPDERRRLMIGRFQKDDGAGDGREDGEEVVTEIGAGNERGEGGGEGELIFSM